MFFFSFSFIYAYVVIGNDYPYLMNGKMNTYLR